MSEETPTQTPQTVTSQPLDMESQSDRWMKYGANVVLSSVVVISLAVLLVYVAQRKPMRYDTTSAGLYSLKPQTLKVIQGNKDPITIISLYTKAKPSQSPDDAPEDSASEADIARQSEIVDSLLNEYHAQGNKIEVESIDRVLNPSKVDDLITQVQEQYGGEIKKYRDFANSLPGKFDAIKKAADPEVDKIRTLLQQIQTVPEDQITNADLAQSVELAITSVNRVPKALKDSEEDFAQKLKQKPPDYKGITDSVTLNMTVVSAMLNKVTDDFKHFKDDKEVPQAIRDYMARSLPVYLGLKRQADDLVNEVKGLGELKLDTLREALRQKNPILVKNNTEWRVIPYEKVWKTDARDRSSDPNSPVHPRFAGEQLITGAILALENPKKQKVCFVRGGDRPLAEAGGQFSSVADRLRDYNFDVSDKDLSGMWQMQAMQQQMPSTPEPSDADIDDAIWVVDCNRAQQQNPMMGGPPPSTIAPKLAEHLAHGHHWENGKKVDGGSALVMIPMQGEDVSSSLKDFGITPRADAVAVHALVKSEGAESGDRINDAEKQPFIFEITQWGASPVTDTLNGMRGVILQTVPIQTVSVAGVKTTSILPVPGAPENPPCWGETDLSSIEATDGPKFDAGVDMPAPLYAAAMAEKAGSRVVAMGSEYSFVGSDASLSRTIVDFPDPELARKNIFVPRFPGNAELFMNTLFWLSHQEPMIAISPAAMSISRLGNISTAAGNFWRIGVLLIGLPGLVLGLGVFSYFNRRD